MAKKKFGPKILVFCYRDLALAVPVVLAPSEAFFDFSFRVIAVFVRGPLKCGKISAILAASLRSAHTPTIEFFEPAGCQNFANALRQKRVHVLRPCLIEKGH